jgi:transposase-like protein
MDKLTAKADEGRVVGESKSALDKLVREGARRMLQEALENEVTEYLARMGSVRTQAGRQAIVRNGFLPARELVTGVGPVRIRQGRVRDQRRKLKFTSRILPPYLRRVPSVDALIPVLYLKGISTGDFTEALEAILGPNAAGLSATNIVRLKEGWQKDYEAWAGRDLRGKRYIYYWADGIYFNVRLDTERPCLLILMGALEDGTKELITVWDGIRESKESWLEVLRDLKARGLVEGPELAVGDGALGFWAALEEEFPQVREQRCWVHSVPRRAQTRRVKCPSPDKTSESGSWGQMAVAQAAVMKHVRRCMARTHAGPANKPTGRSYPANAIKRRHAPLAGIHGRAGEWECRAPCVRAKTAGNPEKEATPGDHSSALERRHAGNVCAVTGEIL